MLLHPARNSFAAMILYRLGLSSKEDGVTANNVSPGERVIYLSKKQFRNGLLGLFAVMFILALGFYHLGSRQNLLDEQSSGGAPTLHTLQQEIAKMNAAIAEMNTLKDRFANLAMPEPIKTALQKEMGGGLNQASFTTVSSRATDPDSVFAPLSEKDLAATAKELALMNARLQQTEANWLKELNLLSHMPTGSPIENHAGLSSNYGSRIDPFTKMLSYHSGVDFSAPAGTIIYATGDGRVARTDFDRGNGQFIVIEHAEGFTSKYAHIKRFLIREGEKVKRGQAIAEVGTTGRSTSPHLHYEIAHRGMTINPMMALGQRSQLAEINSGKTLSKK
jgi:murein DD-endopeptidase MepM/ murein hydrolase activator NlpD